jgi:hypothetical protein
MQCCVSTLSEYILCRLPCAEGSLGGSSWKQSDSQLGKFQSAHSTNNKRSVNTVVDGDVYEGRAKDGQGWMSQGFQAPSRSTDRLVSIPIQFNSSSRSPTHCAVLCVCVRVCVCVCVDCCATAHNLNFGVSLVLLYAVNELIYCTVP